jgi:membrane protein DedA with SNARE-associated domain|tara:strand:+ start:3967 stop:4191 length:225 start_codon:yes stop_codon:yes gene_type:complete
MNKTEKVALRESIIVVIMGAVINFPLQTYLLWLTIDNWQWSNPLKISIFIQIIITVVALIRVYTIRMRFQRGKF